MNDGGQFLIFGAFALIAIGGAIFGYFRRQQRRKAMAALAAELGMSFDPTKDYSHDEEYANFEIFRKGHSLRGRSRAAYNTLRGSVEIDGRRHDVKMGDFRYKIRVQTNKGSHTQTRRFSYLIVDLPFGNTPPLVIRPEGVFDKIAGAIGFDDIDFESSEFSRKFHVKSDDKRFAYDVVDQRMMDFLLQTCDHTIDIEHGRCLVSDGERKWKPEQFKARLAWSREFLDRWPDHLTRRLEEEGAGAGRF